MAKLANMIGLIEVISVTEDEGFEKIFAIRRTVFVEEQNVPEDEEYDGYEHISHHYLALVNGIPAGTCRWRITPGGKLKIERFAVLQEYRGYGIGRALMKRVLAEAPTALYETYLHAQEQVITFYERLGFHAEGPLFDECGIMHRKMIYSS